MGELTYQLPETVVADTKAFRGVVEKSLAGQTSPVAFRGIRVPMGIYEQRVNDTYMVRVRGAGGVFHSNQAKVIADLAQSYGNGVVHVTTRQDLQIHSVKIEDTPTILERLLEVGLSSRGGGGNTVRNISACPEAGICPDEVFDVTPYALALTEYLIRERANFNLPRKFKVAFSGCRKDCGLASVADLGFFAHECDGARGFAVYAGGGMGAHSALAIPIEEFIPAEAIFEVAEAVKRLFDKHGDRTNRARARLRFVVERLGAEGFRQAYRDERALVRRQWEGEASLSHPCIPTGSAKLRPPVEVAAVPVHLPLGDISAETLIGLADIAETLGDGTIRTTQEQNLQLRVTSPKERDAVAAISKLDERFAGSSSAKCVACAGASTCKLGLCLSRGLAEAIDDELRGVELPFEPVIRISGCPNSCGHHPIVALGFFGGAARSNGKLVPFYSIMAGGRVEEGNASLARQVARIPAKAVPKLLREFFAAARLEHKDGECFTDLMTRWGADNLRQLAKAYETVPSYEESPDFYRDFGTDADFSLAGRGPGECGAGVTDVISFDISEARRAIKEDRLYDAIVAASRALLVTRGLESTKDRDVLAAFAKHLIEPGWVSRGAQKLLDAAIDLKLGDRDSLADLQPEIEALVERVSELFASLDSNLEFRVKPVEESAIVDAGGDGGVGPRPADAAIVHELDLSGVACPMNFVRAKLQLEQIEVGEMLDIFLDQGEPAQNVPASLADQGQEVISITHAQDRCQVRVRRKW